ncbi:Gfo/Idh/MocA family oxidoreductase [Psychromonas sp. Urea-02u-13]|uniref:Gfo/Idh/MocA family oxidoreductase n=1 Tax=Psychromonas sp. Urea-02u-13 TaxID=2058326 RepID=UPI000C32FAB7|nr:Gfo/Idh/MocA family oxidoreductase [Psychromonas sp. Urea-02u-13]PKG39106.1 thiazolinyl imide reductase [Psychromonas sp. Urea-02u-13]
MNKPKKVVIVGAKFGEIYLNAFIESHLDLELAGIVSTGSKRSLQLAEAFAVPLFRDITELPQDIDIACVVIRSSIIGGTGNLLVEALLQRKIHVIQEHPISVNALNRHKSLAQKNAVFYWVNGFYAATTVGRTLISNTQSLRNQSMENATYGNLTTSRQLLYSSLDLLLQSLGTNVDLTPTLLARQRHFDIINLNSEQGDFLLQLQNYLDPQDPDMHNLAMHRIMLGWNNGYFSLADSYGPLTWTPVLYASHHQSNDHCLYQLASLSEGEYLNQTTTQTLSSNSSRVQDTFEDLGPEGVLYTLKQLSRAIDGKSIDKAMTIEYQLKVAQLWEEISHLVGRPIEKTVSPEMRVNLSQPEQGLMGS